MDRQIEATLDRLVDLLGDAVIAALKAKGFHPSQKFTEELSDLIRSHIGLGS